MTRAFTFAVLFGLFVSSGTPGTVLAQITPVASDPLIPVTKPQDAIVGPLAMVTILSSNLAASRNFYQNAMEMTVTTHRVSGQQARDIARTFKVPPQNHFDIAIFSRSGIPQAAKIRVIEVTSNLLLARPLHDAEFVGPLSLGFPVHHIERRADRLAAAGIPATSGVTVLSLKRTDGSPYEVKEAHFKGPDGVLSLGIDRADMQSVGPIAPNVDIGGPAYSGMIVSDIVATDRFLADILGFEKRRDVVLASSGPNGGLGLPAGTRFAFQQWFASGAGTGYLVVMDYENAGKPAPQPLGGGAYGIARLSFSTRDLNAVMARARAHNATILQAPRDTRELGLGRVRTAVLATPDGLPIEVFEARVSPR